MKFIKYCMLAGIMGSSAFANAWDGDYTGKIRLIDVYEGFNPFRIFLDVNMSAVCKSDYAYVSPSQTTYQSFVSVLLAAKMADKTVRVYTTKDADGYCRISYLTLM